MKEVAQVTDQLLAAEAIAGRSRWLILGALAIWLGTSAVALGLRDPGQFSRAGAVGTGLVLAAFSVSAAARQSYQTHLLKGLVLVTRANLRDAGGPPKSGPGAAPDAPAGFDHDRHLDMIGRLLVRLDRRGGSARALEVSAAGLATLQWGYGDLLLNRALICGAFTC